jgi:hypothetical protein
MQLILGSARFAPVARAWPVVCVAAATAAVVAGILMLVSPFNAPQPAARTAASAQPVVHPTTPAGNHPPMTDEHRRLLLLTLVREALAGRPFGGFGAR